MSANPNSVPPSSTAQDLEARLTWLLDLSLSMLSTRDLEGLLKTSVNAFIEIADADRGFLYVWDRKNDQLVFRGGLNADHTLIEAEERRIAPVVNRVMRERRPLVLGDPNSGSDPAVRRVARNQHIEAMFCTPLLNTHDEFVGIVYVDGKSKRHTFNTEDHRIASILSAHVAAAVENACLFERASNDPLTGLPNNSHFLLQLAKVMREATLENAAGILLLDLDQFKRVNQIAGAEMGDRALVDVAHTLQEVLRADALVARWGSDKFGILLPPDPERIAIRLRDVAERARASVFTKTYHNVHMSASIGGVAFPGDAGSKTAEAQSAPDLVAIADDALSRARERGDGHVEIG